MLRGTVFSSLAVLLFLIFLFSSSIFTAKVPIASNTTLSAATTAVTNPTTEPLVQQGDLTYLGAFRVPSGRFGSNVNAVFDYSDAGLAYNPADNSLFIKGHVYGQLVAEISIPALVNSTDINALNTASVLQNFSDITNGRLNTENIGNGMRLGGLLVYDSKLIAAEWGYYDGPGIQTKSHFVSSLNLSSTGGAQGPFKVGNLFAAFVGGSMTTIPSEWQSLLGGPALTGHCCTAISSHESWGPSASVFDPGNLGVVSPVPATPVVYYTQNHPTLGRWGQGTNPIYNNSTLMNGIVFAPGTRSVLFFGRTGLGAQCYGIGTSSPSLAGQRIDGGDLWCLDPATSNKGTHAYPYSYYVWAYDANDFLAVKTGAKNPWDIRPYTSWTFTMPFSSASGTNVINGAAYDSATKRIYIEQGSAGGGNSLPLIEVYQLSVGTAIQSQLPTPPTTSSGGSSYTPPPVTSSGGGSSYTLPPSVTSSGGGGGVVNNASGGNGGGSSATISAGSGTPIQTINSSPSETTPIPNPLFRRSLSLGMQGDDVRALQQILIQDGFLSAAPTGFYGPLTTRAVEQFQAQYSIVSSGSSFTTGYGSIGPRTLAKLNLLYATTTPTTTSTSGTTTSNSFQHVLYPGLRSSEVTALQQFLAGDPSIYPEGLITGFYGPLTTRAVERFQTKYGIISSGSPLTTGYGLVGPKTRARLSTL